METLKTIVSLIPAIISAISSVEDWFQESGISSAGSEKLQAVIDIMTNCYEGLSEMIEPLTSVINTLVALANKVGIFSSSSGEA